MGSYTGPERRVNGHECRYEEKIGLMSDAVIRTEGKLENLDLRINGSLEKIGKHIDDSDWWRKFIAGTAITLIITILGFAGTSWAISYNLGQYAQQIITVTKRADDLNADLKRHLYGLDKLYKLEQDRMVSDAKS